VWYVVDARRQIDAVRSCSETIDQSKLERFSCLVRMYSYRMPWDESKRMPGIRCE
jgi:hypothetical protein